MFSKKIKERANFFEQKYYEEKFALEKTQAALNIRESQLERFDSIYFNLRTGQGTSSDVSSYTSINQFKIYSFQELETLAACDPIISKILKVITDVVFKDEFDIVCEDDKQYFKQFKKLWRSHNLDELFYTGSRAGYVFGHSFLWLDVEDGFNDEEAPLVIERVKKIRNIEMINRYFLAADPEERTFTFDPLYYYLVMQPLVADQFDLHNDKSVELFRKEVSKLAQEKIHYSRLLGFWGNRLDPYLFRTNLHFHDTYIRKIHQASQHYHVAMDNISALLSKIPMPIAKIKNLSNLLTVPGQVDKFRGMMAAREQIRSTNNVSAIDAEESYEYYTPTFAGIGELIEKAERRLCIETEIPHDILLGEGSTGSTSGRTEKTNFERFIESEQRIKIKPKIEFFMRLFQQVYKLKIPENYEIIFEHSERATEIEESQTLVNNANACAILTEQGFDCTDFLTSKYPQIKKDLSFDELDNMDLNEDVHA